MANKVAFTFTVVDRFSAAADRIKRKMAGIKTASERLGTSLEKTGKRFTAAGDRMQALGRRAAVGSAALAAFGFGAIRASAKLETMAIALGSVAGGAEEGKRALEELKAFTATTPFQLDQVVKAGTQLLGAGVATQDLTDTLRSLGDVSAALNTPLDGLAAIFSKVKARGRLTTEELNQLTERGLNFREVLTQQLGVSVDQLEKGITKGFVKFPAFERALRSLSAEGGKFAGATARLSLSTEGLLSTLRDNLGFAFAAIGDAIAESINFKDVLASTIQFVGRLTGRITAFARENPKLTKFFVILGALGAVLAPLLIVAGSMVAFFGFMATGAAALGVALGPVIAAVTALSAALAGLLAFKPEAFSFLFGGGLGDLVANKVFGFEDVPTPDASETNVNVTVSAERGTRAEVASTSSGPSPPNVGRNMERRL